MRCGGERSGCISEVMEIHEYESACEGGVGCVCRGWRVGGLIVELVTYWGKEGGGCADPWAQKRSEPGLTGEPVPSLAGCVTSGRSLSLSNLSPLLYTDQRQ